MSLLAVTSGDIASGTNVVSAEGVDFDGTYDYLSRSTDLVGNIDSKTFTFSCWVYVQDMSISQSFVHIGANGIFHVSRISSTQFRVLAYNTTPTAILNVSFNAVGLEFLNILISCDLSSASNRYVYLNDNIANNLIWATYTNDFIDFTQTTWAIGGATSGLLKTKGRLSNVFLDYTYRNLSIEANRRLFITADGKPTPTATLKALNPILYLPMKDAATAHINEGTGGNFTANGTFATSNRGANQDNCVASYFDGTADYLSRTSLTGAADGKQFTFSGNIFPYKTLSGDLAFYTSIAGSGRLSIYSSNTSASLIAKNAAGVTVLSFNSTIPLVIKKTGSIQISVDLSDTAKRKVIFNGVDITYSITWDTYLNDTVDFTCDSYSIGGRSGNSYFQGNIGELYFDTKYIDLATSNPFWNSVENKPVPVRKVIADTGVTPLIAMPIRADIPGKNYGTGGDFTLYG